MTSPKTASEFVEVLEQASLIAPVHLQRVRNQIPAPNSPGFDSLSFAKALVKEGMLTPFQVKRLLAGRREGFFIGKYRLLDVLGQGGMGRVYLAEQITMKRAVALKLIRFGDHENPTILVRFAREARAAAKLRHPNITQAFDFDQAGDYHYIAMEFIEGVTLQDWIQKTGVMPWAQAAYYMAQASSALEHAHQAGLVHRDVKPGNMMVDVAGALKLLDLGLVNVPTEDDSLTLAQRDMILGTADYVAPEQAINSHTVDIRADLYSLGGVFYYLLTGRPPFSGKSAAQKIIAHQTEELRPLSEVAPEVPKRLADVVHKLMAKKAEDRYQTPTELLQTLRPFAQAAARSTPPYDASLVRFNRDLVDKYLRFGVDAPPANNVPPANFGQATMGDFRIPADVLTPKPGGELASSVISKPVTPITPRTGTARKKAAARLTEGDANKSTMTQSSKPMASPSRPTPIPPNKKSMSIGSKTDVPPARRKPKRSRSWYLRLGLFFIVPNLAAVLLLWAMVARTPQPAPNPQKDAPPQRSVITITKTDAAPSLAKAFENVGAEGQIILDSRDTPMLVDGLNVVGAKLANHGRFTLASRDKSKSVILTAEATPILRVGKAEDFLLRDVILDGKGRPGPVIEIEGRSAGVTLQNVVFRNVVGIAVRLLDAQGQPDKPLRFVNCTFENSESCTAIHCQGRSFEGWTRNVEFSGCTFSGLATGILFAQPAENIAIRNCVFAKGIQGVRFAPAPILPDLAAIRAVTDWRTAGPFGQKELPAFDPQLPGDSQPLQWKAVKSAQLDLSANVKGKNDTLACTAFRSPIAGPRRLFIATADETIVWVNGQKVFEHSDQHPYMPRAFAIVANFHSGDNPIWVQTKAGKFALEVADNYLPLSGASWRNIRIESNLFDGTVRGIEFGAAPNQDSMVRVMGNQFREASLHPLAVLKSAETLRPGTIVAAENQDTSPMGRPAISADYELLPVH